MIGVGVDLVELAGFEAMLARRGERLVERVFTDGERAWSAARARPAPHLAARFAAKEAAMKALGTGWAKQIDWREIEVCCDARGATSLALHGTFARLAADAGVRASYATLTHTGGYASAAVILTGDP